MNVGKKYSTLWVWSSGHGNSRKKFITHNDSASWTGNGPTYIERAKRERKVVNTKFQVLDVYEESH